MLRCLDVVLVLLALGVLSPALVVVALILRFTGEGEVFYIQERVGKGGNKFGLIKFATMVKNSPTLGTGTITLRDDPRVLPVGRILRKTKINELPQLFNILMGDMSLIGPRPLTANHYYAYSQEAISIISTVRPGLSGVGSIVFRDEERLLSHQKDPGEFYAAEIAPFKAKLEVWFVENQSLMLYVKCLAMTLWVIFFPSSQLTQIAFKGLPQPKGELAKNLHSR